MALVSYTQPHVHLSQGTVVVGALLFGFVLWLAVNQRLGVYWAILIGGGAAAGAAPAPATTPAAPPGAASGGAGQAPGSDPTAPMVIPNSSDVPASAASPDAAPNYTGGF